MRSEAPRRTPSSRIVNQATRLISRASRGFTLLEMLVVVTLVAIMATFAVLYIGNRPLEDQMNIEARRLNELVGLAAEQAVQQGTELGLLYTRDGYEFLVMDPKTERWQPVTSGVFRARHLPDPLQIELRVEGRVVPPASAEEVSEFAQQADAAGDAMEAPKDTARKGDAASGPKPHVLILSSGELTAFILDLHARGYTPFFRLQGDVLGRLSLTRLEAPPAT